MGNLRKKGVALVKILFSALLLYFVFRRIPFSEVWETVRDSHPAYLMGALVFFVGSKALAALRLNRYFHEIQIPLTGASNAKLYLLGMFYNLFLPGGIGGDAYKGYVLRRDFGAPVRKVVAVLLLDRISGLYLLVVYSGLLLFWLSPEWFLAYRPALVPALVLSLGLYWWAHRRFFGYVQPVFWTAGAYSAGVQIAQLVTAYLILRAIGVTEEFGPYLLLFLLSSIVAVLPITIGGIGSRELLFYYGALWFGLEEAQAIGLSMVFFIVTAVVSLCGIYFHFRKPVLQLHPAQGDNRTR